MFVYFLLFFNLVTNPSEDVELKKVNDADKKVKLELLRLREKYEQLERLERELQTNGTSTIGSSSSNLNNFNNNMPTTPGGNLNNIQTPSISEKVSTPLLMSPEVNVPSAQTTTSTTNSTTTTNQDQSSIQSATPKDITMTDA